MEKFKKLCLFFTIILAFSLFNASLIYASADKTEIYINGLKLTTDAEPVIKDGRTYVPLRVIGEALGFDVAYDESSRTVEMNQPDLHIAITMKIGSGLAYINGEETVLDAPPFIAQNRTMVPVRFIGEALNGRVIWQEGYSGDYYSDFFEGAANKVIIYCSHPVKLPSGNARIASRMFERSWSLTDADGSQKTVGYDVIIPEFSGMKDEAFQTKLNKRFYDEIYQFAETEMGNVYEDQKAGSTDYLYNASYDYSFSVISDGANVLSILASDYMYLGGAHGMPAALGVNIDFDRSEIMALSDLFIPDKDYGQKLIDEMLAMQKLSSTAEYAGVNEVTELPWEYNFYFEDGCLVIFYSPYELASYARGFVQFRIPLDNLKEYLKEEYQLL